MNVNGIKKAPRILMCCGYTQNARIFRGRMSAVRKALNGYELVFLDPPHKMSMPSTESNAQFDSENGVDEDNRAWWFSKAEEGRKHYEKFDECLVYLREFMDSQEPFEGVWGFSQGAAMAAILTAILENPQSTPAFATSKFEPFKFCIVSCGFLPLDPSISKLFSPLKPLSTPSLHILGRGDTIVTADRSLPLAETFATARIEYHEGGHFTPSKMSWRQFYVDYISSFFLEAGQEAKEIESPYGSKLEEETLEAKI